MVVVEKSIRVLAISALGMVRRAEKLVPEVDDGESFVDQIFGVFPDEDYEWEKQGLTKLRADVHKVLSAEIGPESTREEIADAVAVAIDSRKFDYGLRGNQIKASLLAFLGRKVEKKVKKRFNPLAGMNLSVRPLADAAILDDSKVVKEVLESGVLAGEEDVDPAEEPVFSDIGPVNGERFIDLLSPFIARWVNPFTTVGNKVCWVLRVFLPDGKTGSWDDIDPAIIAKGMRNTLGKMDLSDKPKSEKYREYMYRFLDQFGY